MSRLLRWIALALASIVLYGQRLPFPTYLNPSMLYVGGGPASLLLFNQNYHAGLTALWNGSARPTTPNPNGGYIVTLEASDLTVPQLAQITMVDAQSGAVVDTVNCPVGYDVKPTGVAFDRSRNRLYIATPGQPADPQIPGNSVVALDVTTGMIGTALNTGSALGDLALSDDASALYVVVEGDSVVRRIDPETMTAAGDFYFRPAGYKSPYPGVLAPDMITVMPGKPGTVALGFSPDVGSSGTQIAIFDNGVKRPNTIGTGCCSGMLFSPDGKYFFQDGFTSFMDGPNSGGNQTVMSRYTVDSTGIPNQKPPFAAGSGAAAAADGTLYTSSATTIDYENMRVTGYFGVGGPIAVDTANQRAYILYSPPALNDSAVYGPAELVAFTLPSLETLGSLKLGLTALAALNDSEKLIRFGVDGFILPSTDGLLIFHTPLAGPLPMIAADAVLHAASRQPGAVAPGEILSIYGTNLGPAEPQSASSTNNAFPFLLSDVQVLFDRLTGTPLLASQSQINVITPFELSPGSTVDLQVWYFGNPSARISLPVVSAAPALFTRDGSGSGPVSVINQDGSTDTASPAGSVVTLHGTGGGAAAGAVDGAVARRRANLLAPVGVSVAGRDAQVLYAGAAPGMVNGIFELDVQLPQDLPPGFADITINIDGHDSPEGVSIEIR